MRPSAANHYNAALLDELYTRWQTDPASVDAQWNTFFEGFALGTAQPPRPAGLNGSAPHAGASPDTGAAADATRQARIDELVQAYRSLGHTLARLDPLEHARPDQPLLTLEALGFREADLDQPVSSRYFLGGKTLSLREMIALLQSIYSGPIGAEFMHISATRVRNWVRDRLEARVEMAAPPVAEQRAILGRLLAAEAFERFLHTSYVGQKRFSLEGGETLLPVLETILNRCPALGIQEIVMGMAHRGRLNVLANFMKKSLPMIFTEFSENYEPDLVNGDGDVKYHLGYQSTRDLGEGRKVEVRLASNPSHLEFVDPVVEGNARARQRILNDMQERKRVLPILIHGDAAFIGQGIVAETLNLSQLPGYSTGGTVHLIINNQIGFTTLPADARSSLYCTDIAKMIEAPVFHVNGDDPEAVCFVAGLAADFRQEFGRDVIVDMYCYRRHGHNEGDEPSFTQPDLYAQISQHPSVATRYRESLIADGRVTAEDADAMLAGYRAECDAALGEVREASRGQVAGSRKKFAGSTAVFQPPYSHAPVNTAISAEMLEKVARAVTSIPDSIHVLDKLKRNLLERRLRIFTAAGPYDWSFAETLAFGSLLLDGKPVRLSGQDSRRGTFSQRLSVLYDDRTRERYIPLNNLAEGQARFCVYNSPLSEAAVLGFDYGYSLDYPEMLCLWEAQFGDFVNGAQTIIDQFIVSSESKWQRPSGIVLLLPHGYEGQGPEHSSGRVERFLQACAEDNIQVCNLTTPAQYFHVLRRQMARPFRKPLVIMTPKSLLRAEVAVSYNADFTERGFSEVLETPAAAGAAGTRRVILCTGKVYYDLLKAREANGVEDTALVRVEQLYPLHTERLKEIFASYTAAEKWIWCQEESQNMGAWSFIAPLLGDLLPEGQGLFYAGRSASASVAVGAKLLHDREQKQLVAEAFAL
jgi:2-oxoglutarate dehydrogenase E1 component